MNEQKWINEQMYIYTWVIKNLVHLSSSLPLGLDKIISNISPRSFSITTNTYEYHIQEGLHLATSTIIMWHNSANLWGGPQFKELRSGYLWYPLMEITMPKQKQEANDIPDSLARAPALCLRASMINKLLLNKCFHPLEI